jgi:hypothetical protein
VRVSDKEGRRRAPSEWSQKFVKFCDDSAAEMAKELLSEIDEVPQSERESFVAFILGDELMHFFHKAFALHLKDPAGGKWLDTIHAKRGGRASAIKRRKNSLKQKFLRWALAENARNPGLSKNAVAQRYADENPGSSPATLRRYLAEIPIRGDD